MATPKTYEEWYGNVGGAIPWLAGGENGQAEAGAWPRLLDDILRDQVTQARYQAFPQLAASDALPHLAADRKLLRGPSELESDFRNRLQNPWDQWARAGTWLGLLCQLYWYGATNAVVLQQNGKAATLTGTPVIGQDPTSLYSFTDSSKLGTVLTSTVNQFRKIPANTPWVDFDQNTDLTNRFIVILPSWPFAEVVMAVFNNTDNVAVNWPVRFVGNYNAIVGPPNAPVDIDIDGVNTNSTTLYLNASAPWTGVVWAVGWKTGVNPLNIFSSAGFGELQSIITTWRSNAHCMGVYAYGTSQGAWGWPIRKWGSGDKWGQTNVIKILGGF